MLPRLARGTVRRDRLFSGRSRYSVEPGMADTRSAEQRRRIMQSVRTKDTGPEWIVRRLLHRRGYRFRLHPKHLPGRPDIVLPGRRIAIFVHGCFWHGHECRIGHLPKSRLEYWRPKIAENQSRDTRKATELSALGWTVMVVWQCETKEVGSLLARLVRSIEDEPLAANIRKPSGGS